jgi:hypothetical protein
VATIQTGDIFVRPTTCHVARKKAAQIAPRDLQN